MRWSIKTADPDQVETFAQEIRQSSIPNLRDPRVARPVARLLLARGVSDIEAAEEFLAPSLSQLNSPFLMRGMKAAVDRLAAAIERKESILVYGDYDVDGTTAIVILKTAIELCGGTASFHVPHRIREGYDLRSDVIEQAAASGIRLIVSVDAGIRAFAAAETARRVGVDLIITDHHLPGEQGMPEALAVLNPNQPGCEYPCKALCGAGVAFKLAQGLMERKLAGKDQSRLLMSFMKIVAIATVADSVPLVGENRVFARLGLDGLRSVVNPGLKALLEVAKLGGRSLTSGEVAFRIAPRINAAGRMDVARDIVDLFSVTGAERAREIAIRLDRLNTDRQEEERRIMEAILARCEEQPKLQQAFCVVIDGEGWHRGVIGITATRVVERYGRPALVISRDGDEAHGSGRSIAAFHLLEAMESCSHLFTRYGGHAHAVGFSLPAARIDELRAHLDTYARERLALTDFEPRLSVDAEVTLDQVTPELWQALRMLEPFGAGNAEPVFSAKTVRLMAPPRVMQDKHVKFKLRATEGKVPEAEGEVEMAAVAASGGHTESAARDGAVRDGAVAERRAAKPLETRGPQCWRSAVTYNAMGWRMAEKVQKEQLLPGDILDVAFTLDHNDHPDFGGLELSLRDFKRAQ